MERSDESSLERARRYLDLGISIFPVERAGKKPLVEWRVYQFRYAREGEIEAWFGGKAPANIGIACGTLSGVVVVDSDSDEAEAWICSNLSDTSMKTKTARGRHRFYVHPGVGIGNKAHVEFDGKKLALDLRGDGGYVLAPGSIHPSGVIYEEEGDWSLIPPRLDMLIISRSRREPQRIQSLEKKVEPPSHDDFGRVSFGVGSSVERRAAAYLSKCEKPVEGQGSDAATWQIAAFLVRDLAMEPEQAVRMLTEWTGFDEWWVRSKVRSAVKNGRKAVGEGLR